MKTLVTIMSCNDYCYTKCCIKRLFESTKEPFDVLLINNSFNNDKRTQAAFEELDDLYPDRITMMDNGKNLGIAASLNKAFDYFLRHGYMYFAQFHIDNYVGPNWLENFYKAIINYNIKAVAPLEQNDHFYFPEVNARWDRKLQDNKKFFELSEDLDLHINNIFDGDFNKEALAIQEQYKYVLIPDTFSFSAYMLDRDVINTVGYFDEDFFPGSGEDRDFYNRMKAKNISSFKYGGMFVIHWGSITYIHSGNIQGRESSAYAANQLIEKEFEYKGSNYCMRKSCCHNIVGACAKNLMGSEFSCIEYVLDEQYTKRNNRERFCKQ